MSHEVLREDLFADRNYPPFDRVAMDGIGISLLAWQEGVREFPIQDCQRAGEPRKKLKIPNHCIEVMTGAPLPERCDAVIPYEQVQLNEKKAKLGGDLNLEFMMNVHREGSDYKSGDLLVSAGCALESPHWSIAASIGKSKIKISRRPRITLLSTGDELVNVEEEPKYYQIRRSNTYAILSSLRKNSFNPEKVFHLKDNRLDVLDKLRTALNESDFLILSGGVSMGKFDYIPESLSNLGINCIFHKIKQKPGKPMWFGTSKSGQTVFALPGNPVSALICLHRYVLPALNKFLTGQKFQKKYFQYAVLNEKVTFKKSFTYFLPVSLEFGVDGKTFATPVKSNGSGDFSSLIRSHGFLELDANSENFYPGQSYPVYLWG